MDQAVQLPPITNPTVSTVEAMVTEVATLIGSQDSPYGRERALRALDRAADRLNLSGLYLFRRKEVTYRTAALGGSGDTLLEEGDTELALPTDWGWPERGALAVDEDGNRLGDLTWQSWEVFRAISTRDTTNFSNIPQYISIQNEMENVLHVWPPVNVTTSPQLVVIYFARVLRPSEVSDDNLYASKETVEALITGGEAFTMRFRHKQQPGLWRPFMEEFDQVIAKAKGAAHRNQQVLDTWAMPGESGYDGPPPVAPRTFIVDMGI